MIGSIHPTYTVAELWRKILNGMAECYDRNDPMAQMTWQPKLLYFQILPLDKYFDMWYWNLAAFCECAVEICSTVTKLAVLGNGDYLPREGLFAIFMQISAEASKILHLDGFLFCVG